MHVLTAAPPPSHASAHRGAPSFSAPGLAQGIALRPYQKQSLAFMCDVERSKAKSLVGSDGQRGGWLCDEVSVGKTALLPCMKVLTTTP